MASTDVHPTRRVEERENKFEVAEWFVLPDLGSQLPAGYELARHDPVVLETLYLDTDDRVLARSRTALRRRFGGPDAGWHLKVASADPTVRHELQVPGRAAEEIPDVIADALKQDFGRLELRPVLLVRTLRTVQEVLRNHESVAEIAQDDVIAVNLANRRCSAWHEVEVDHRSDHPNDGVAAVVQSLHEAGARPARYVSKQARGLAPVLHHDVATSTSVEPIIHRLRAQMAELLLEEARVRRGEPDAVHLMRVATRRFRSCLQSFGGIFVREPTDNLGAELKWLGAHLGAARDAEVVADLVIGDLEQIGHENLLGPVVASLRAQGTSSIATADAALSRALDSTRYRDLLAVAVSFTNDPPLRSSPKKAKWVEGRLGRTIDRTHKLVATAHAARPDQRDQFLHEVRKSAKDVRYAAETLAPLDPKRFKHVVRDYEAIQEALGRHRDAVVTRTIYREAGARAGVRPTENGFTYGILFGLEDARAQRAIKKFERQWGELQRHRHDS